jgi:phage protein D
MMEFENYKIVIDGDEIPELYQDMIALEVELDEEMAGMFRLHIALLQEQDGTWPYLDDDRFQIWKQVTITAGFENGAEELFIGYITQVKPVFDPDLSESTLEIWGMDGSVLMDREEILKDWPNKKDSDIAQEIINNYGFTPHVEDTEVIHDEAVSTVIQRETDIQFLKRLALRNGLECYVEGTTGFFKSPQVDADPQPPLAVHFGAETNVISFSIEVNALTPANVGMSQIDRANKEILSAAVENSEQEPLGSSGTTELLAVGMNPAQTFMSMNVATGIPEMNALCQGLFHLAEWFITGEGEINANQYGHVLKPRGTVTIKGVGETYSGVYYVIHVTHSFSGDGYMQSFKVRRNALMPTGSEDFAGGNGGLF